MPLAPSSACRGVDVTTDKGHATGGSSLEMVLGGRVSAVVVLRAHVVDIHTVQAAGQ